MEDKRILQNGHITLVNPDPAAGPARQFLAAAGAAALGARHTGLTGNGWERRLPRAQWALSPGAGIVAEVRAWGGAGASFRNTTFDRRAELGRARRMPADGGWPPKELFFLASGAAGAAGAAGAGHLEGWMLEGYSVYLPEGEPPPGGPAGGRPAALLLPAEGPELSLRRFRYSDGDKDGESVARDVAAACAVYLRAGWSEFDVMARVALPALRAASAAGAPYGYNSIVGTVPVPRGAIGEVGPNGRLARPLAMNLRYDEWQETFCSLCCLLQRVDARALKDLGPAEPYPLVVSAVVEGLDDGAPKEAAEAAWAFVPAFRELLAEVGGAGDGGAPGEAERAAQEIARQVLADECGPAPGGVVFPMWWTQFAPDALANALDGGEAEVAARVRDIILLAAAVRAVRPGSPLGAYEGYLAWRQGGHA